MSGNNDSVSAVQRMHQEDARRIRRACLALRFVESDLRSLSSLAVKVGAPKALTDLVEHIAIVVENARGLLQGEAHVTDADKAGAA